MHLFGFLLYSQADVQLQPLLQHVQRVARLVHFVSKSALGVGLWASGWEHEKKGKRNLTLTCSEGVCSCPTYDALLLSDRLELLQIPL